MAKTITFLKNFCGRLDWFTVAVCCSVFFVLSALSLWIYRRIKKRAEHRRLACAELERTAVFTLPEKENSFIRERLNTALNSDGKTLSHKLMEEGFRADYARELIGKLKRAPLSVAERIEVDNVSAFLTECAFKNELGWEEIACLNERLCSALKLAAKYAV